MPILESVGELEDDENPTDERDEDEDGEEEGEETPEVVAPVARPKARRNVPESAAAAGISVGQFGAVPRAATHWLANRRSPVTGEWEPMGYAAPGATAEERQWPIAELSVEEMQRRWGPGTYQVRWVSPNAQGGRRVMVGAHEVRILPPPAAAPPPAAPSGIMNGAVREALDLMNVFEAMADSKLKGMASLMALVGVGGNRGGLDAEGLRAILRDEREANARATKEAIEAMVAPISRRLDELSVDDDEGDDGPGIGAVAAAVPRIKGGGLLATVLNWAQGNPEIAKEALKQGLPLVAGAATKIAEVMSKPATVPPPPPRPRAIASVATPEPAAAPLTTAEVWENAQQTA